MATAANNACNFTYREHIGRRRGVSQCFPSYKKYTDIVRRDTAICESVKSIIGRLAGITGDILTNIKGTVDRFHGVTVPSTNIIARVRDVD